LTIATVYSTIPLWFHKSLVNSHMKCVKTRVSGRLFAMRWPK
jgi:hypothetical protein